MAKFLTVLHVSPVPFTDDLWILDEDLVYQSDVLKATITIKKGFVTDFYSIPWPASMILPKSSQGDEAAVLHDDLYTQKRFSRDLCDRAIAEAMGVCKVSWIRRSLIYDGLRIGGWWGYNKKSKNEPLDEVVMADGSFPPSPNSKA